MGRALALDETEPLRVFVEVLRRGDQLKKSVHKSLVANAAAQRFGNSRRLSVGAVSHRPLRVEGRIPKWLTVFKSRFHPLVQISDSQRGLFRNAAGPRSPPPNTALVLKKTAYRVESSPGWSAGQKKALALCLDHELLSPQLVEWYFRKDPPGRPAGADQNGPLRCGPLGPLNRCTFLR